MGEVMRRAVVGASGVENNVSSFPTTGGGKVTFRESLAQQGKGQGGNNSSLKVMEEARNQAEGAMPLALARQQFERGNYTTALELLEKVRSPDNYLNAQVHELRGDIFLSARSDQRPPERLGDIELKDFGKKALEERVAAKDGYKQYLASEAVTNLGKQPTWTQSAAEWAKVAFANVAYAKLIVKSQKDFTRYFNRLSKAEQYQLKEDVLNALGNAEKITYSLRRLQNMQDTVKALTDFLEESSTVKGFVMFNGHQQ